MRRIGLFSFFILIMILPMAAQVAVGVRAGGAYSSLVQKVENVHRSGSRCGYSVAGVVDIPFYKRFSLRPELGFVNQGGSFYSGQDFEGMALFNKYWYYSLQIPVNVAYTFPVGDVHFFVFGGPVVDISLFGKMRTKDTELDLHFGHSEEKDLKPFDLGVSLGFGGEYKNFFFTINSIVGTLDRRAVDREGESSVFQNNVTISIGYFFKHYR
ncbi:porin family protein [Parabacteroides sp. PF5-9]|uniref:porin family protein n=1 Tax=Parabacteroides sp. PF5-9 TaxID=1742404 RepID=UPI002476792E|nr:porin family protein [Parabacteroides sp. PF5-9]MDH6356291.1 hypothetical protein [Parabacteroides sp. PF5-9]